MTVRQISSYNGKIPLGRAARTYHYRAKARPIAHITICCAEEWIGTKEAPNPAVSLEIIASDNLSLGINSDIRLATVLTTHGALEVVKGILQNLPGGLAAKDDEFKSILQIALNSHEEEG